MRVTLEELRKEAEEVIALRDDEQYVGGQELAHMVLEYVKTKGE